MTRTDEDIRDDVRRELAWDPRLRSPNVEVQVESGVVTLTGTVDSSARRHAVEKAAHRIAGVHHVANEIDVTVPTSHVRSDTEIAQAVRRTLEWDALVDAEGVRSTASGGHVVLEGTVGTLVERDEAERAVQALEGVRSVTNRIVVRSAIVQANRAREAIAAALRRRAEREARHITVEVVSPETVALRGYARSWQEKRAALWAARCAPGIRDVEDHIEIDPSR